MKQKLSKKALEDAIKKDFLLSSDFVGVFIIHNGEETKYHVTFREYLATIYDGAFGVSGWFSGLSTLTRLERLIQIVNSFDNED